MALVRVDAAKAGLFRHALTRWAVGWRTRLSTVTHRNAAALPMILIGVRGTWPMPWYVRTSRWRHLSKKQLTDGYGRGGDRCGHGP
jgi:hypothetical protein